MKRVILLIILFVVSYASADPIVHDPNFMVEKIMDRIDGQTPRLEVIRNSEYGSGVMTASINNGILKIMRISQSSVELFASMPDFPAPHVLGEIGFDDTGLADDELYVTVTTSSGCGNYIHQTSLLRVSKEGIVTLLAEFGDCSDNISIGGLDFGKGSLGYGSSMYLADYMNLGGNNLFRYDFSSGLELIVENLVPPGRSDLDVVGMEFDPTGLYGSNLIIAGSDGLSDGLAGIYQLLPDWSWLELSSPVSSSVRAYRDMAISSGGSFGQMLYVTDTISETIMTVNSTGVHTTYASGFSGILSLTVSEDGDFMYVSDSNGIHRIKAITTLIGPTVSMQEPKVASDGVFTDPSGASSLRLLWNEPVTFTNNDVEILNELGQSVSLSVSGSNSQFMIIAFGDTLLNDKYTITIKDTVVSAETGNPIDGDDDGFSGGNAVIVMEHRQRHDSDNDNDVDLADLSALAEKWLWQE